jgi:hypothetical protein
MRPVRIISPGAVQIVNGGTVAIVNWKIDTGGRGEVDACLGEVLIAIRDHMNKCFDDVLLALPTDRFDASRSEEAEAAMQKVLRKE